MRWGSLNPDNRGKRRADNGEAWRWEMRRESEAFTSVRRGSGAMIRGGMNCMGQKWGLNEACFSLYGEWSILAGPSACGFVWKPAGDRMRPMRRREE